MIKGIEINDRQELIEVVHQNTTEIPKDTTEIPTNNTEDKTIGINIE